MCKYCNRLEEVRKNERREFIKICNKWKRDFHSLEKKYEALKLEYEVARKAVVISIDKFREDMAVFLNESEVNDDA